MTQQTQLLQYSNPDMRASLHQQKQFIMKSKFTIFALLALILLPSCVVTRSRYGNGLSIEMPEVFKKGDRNQHETKQKPEKRKIRFSSEKNKDSNLIAGIDTPLIQSKDSQVSVTSPVTINHLVSNTSKKYSGRSPKLSTKKAQTIQKSTSSASITSASEHKSAQITSASKNSDGFLDMLFELFMAIIVGFAIITLVIYLILMLLPAEVSAIILLSICVIGWLIELLD